MHTATNKQLIAANMRPTTAAIACTTVMLVDSSKQQWVMRQCFGILAAERLVRQGVKGSNLEPVTWLRASKRPCLLLLREGAAAVAVDEFVLQFESFALADIVNYNLHIYIAAACIHKDYNHIPRSHMPVDSTRHMQRKDFNMPLRIASIHTASHHSSKASDMPPCTVAVPQASSCCTWPVSAWSSWRTRRRPMRSSPGSSASTAACALPRSCTRRASSA